MTSVELSADELASVQQLAAHDFEALFDDDELVRLGEVASDLESVRTLRAALGMLARSSTEIMGRCDDVEASSGAFLALSEALESRIVSHRAEGEVLASASARVGVLLAKLEMMDAARAPETSA